MRITYIFLRGVMDTMRSPKKINFVSHAMEPVVSKVNTQEGKYPSKQVLFKVYRSPVGVDITVNTEFQSLVRQSCHNAFKKAM
jgi:hypothetical protein